MSVLVIAKYQGDTAFPGDTAKFRQALAVITSAGTTPAPPEITVSEAVSSPGQF